MTLKKYRVPALLLAALTAVVMTFAMAVMVQSAYAADEYDVVVEGVEGVVPGDILNLTAKVMKDGKETTLPEGSAIRWYLGGLGVDLKESYVIANDTTENKNREYDEYVQVVTDDTTVAMIHFKTDDVADPFGEVFGITASLEKDGEKLAESDTSQFQLANQFDDVKYEFNPEFDPYLFKDKTQDVKVIVMHHEKGKETKALSVRYVWKLDNDGVQILNNGNPVTQMTGENETFTFKRIDAGKNTEAALTIYDANGDKIIENEICFQFEAVTNDLAGYQIEFNGNAEDPFVFVDKADLPITKDSEACRITVVSGNGDRKIVPEDAYDLKIQKVIGYNEATWEDVLQPASFPLDVDPAGSFTINGDRSEGTAQYIITAVAKNGSGYTGQTGSGTGGLWLLDRKTITWPAVSAGFPDKNYNIYQFRYEVKKGKKLTPFATSIETLQNLTQNKDYSVRYINKKTNKVYTSFPTKLGEYSVVFSGISPYYGQQDGIDLMIGKKNPVKAKGKTIICKTKMKKGKTKKAKSFNASKAVKVTKAKGTVSYIKVSGNKNITVSDSGKIKVKKGTKKGTYKVKIEVTAQGTSTYIAGTKKVTVKIKVK